MATFQRFTAKTAYRIRPYEYDNRRWGIWNTLTMSWVFTGTHAQCVGFCMNGSL